MQKEVRKFEEEQLRLAKKVVKKGDFEEIKSNSGRSEAESRVVGFL